MKALCFALVVLPILAIGGASDVRPAPCDVPELLRLSDGRPVDSVAVWERERRPELLKLFTDRVFGRRPEEKPRQMSFDSLGADESILGGKGVRRRVRVTSVGSIGTNSFDLTLYLPSTASARKPVPAFVMVCLTPETANCAPEKGGDLVESWPIADILARGYATAGFHKDQLSPDMEHGNLLGVFSAYETRKPYRGMGRWGTISAWAWGASRVMDYLVTLSEIDSRHVAIVGHSRGGKTALWAGVTDERFALVCSNDSGCGGAKLNHVDLPDSEHVAQIVSRFPYWFAPNYTLYANCEREVAFDQHELLALVAPRLLCVNSASEDKWAGPYGEFLSAKLASPVWELYGRQGLVGDAFPEPDGSLTGGSVAYHLRKGVHHIMRWDWERYLDFADRHGFRGTTAVPEAVRNARRFQAEIDRVAAAGGGTVTVPAGKWRIAPLELKSGVELKFAPGARFYASTNWSDYAVAKMPSLVFATNATNVKVTGALVFGEGWAFPRACGSRSPNRYKMVVFTDCRGVTVADSFLGDGPSWTLVFDHCEDVTVRKVKIRAHANYNNDGIDICDTRRVLIAECDIDSDDDAIVFKSRDPHGVCGEAEVCDCLLSANCNMIKCGTESKGAFRDITVSRCRLVARTPSLVYNRRAGWMTVEGDEAGQGAISLEVVDGGSLENVRLSDIEMDRAAETAIFIRLGRRKREGLGESFLRNVVLEDIRGSVASTVACSITGVPAEDAAPALRPADIILKNVTLSVPGGVAAADVPADVPEQVAAYPENNMFKSVLPAFGFYVRHADRVTFEDVSVTPRRPDARPPVVAEDCSTCHLEVGSRK